MIQRLNIYFSFNSFLSMFRKPIESWEDDSLFFLNHARSGISIALESLDLPKDAKVGVMLYNCDTVMNAANNLGHELVFIDVDNELRIDLRDLERKRIDISVLVLTHLFGITNAIRKIREKYPDLIIIEDCAHAWGAKLPSGEKAGTVGDFSVFSVGMAKFPSIGDGGFLKVYNMKYKERVANIYRSISAYSKTDEIKLIIKMLLNRVIYYPHIYRYITRHMKKVRNQNINLNVKYKLHYKVMSQLVKNRLIIEKSDIDSYLIKQTRNASTWNDFLKQSKKNIWVIYDSNSNFFMLPIWCENKSEFIAEMESKGIEVATHFDKSLIWAEQFGYKIGSCSNTENLLKHLVQLPCHYNINNESLNRKLQLNK